MSGRFSLYFAMVKDSSIKSLAKKYAPRYPSTAEAFDFGVAVCEDCNVRVSVFRRSGWKPDSSMNADSAQVSRSLDYGLEEAGAFLAALLIEVGANDSFVREAMQMFLKAEPDLFVPLGRMAGMEWHQELRFAIRGLLDAIKLFDAGRSLPAQRKVLTSLEALAGGLQTMGLEMGDDLARGIHGLRARVDDDYRLASAVHKIARSHPEHKEALLATMDSTTPFSREAVSSLVQALSKKELVLDSVNTLVKELV